MQIFSQLQSFSTAVSTNSEVGQVKPVQSSIPEAWCVIMRIK